MLLTSTVDFKDELEKVMFDHINDEVSSSSSEMAIQPDNEVAVAEKNTTKKARKEDSKKKREAKNAAVNQMAAKIFSKQAAECVKCKTLTEELCGIKGELEKREKQLYRGHRKRCTAERKKVVRVTRKTCRSLIIVKSKETGDRQFRKRESRTSKKDQIR